MQEIPLTHLASLGYRDGELVDAFFTTEVPEDQKDKSLKRGRGSQSKTKVLVMCEITPRNTA